MDSALELCKRCLLHNKSCAKAWILMGRIFDSQNKHEMAIKCLNQKTFAYRNSLVQSIESAKLELKIGNRFKAIDIATKVMVDYTDFDMTSFLDKCVSCLKQ